MAEEGEGNLLNTRKRKSTEPIPNSPKEKSTDQEGPPPEKLTKRNEDSNTTKEVVEDEGQLPTDICSDATNSEIKLIPQNEEKQVEAIIESTSRTEINITPATPQIPNDTDSISHSKMDDIKSIVKDATINGKEDENDQNIVSNVNENENMAVQSNIDGFESKVDRTVEDELIILDETGNTSFIEDDFKPIISISFSSQEAFKNYSQEFSAFCEKYSEFQVNQDTVTLSINLFQTQETNINHHAAQWNAIDKFDTNQMELNFQQSPANQQKNSKRKQSRVKKELFTLDATPSISTSGSGCQYTSKFAAINIEPKVENDGKTTKKLNLSTCFNCDGPHAMKDCTLPKNYQKINQSRNNFQKKYQQTNRYHVDEEQKYSHIRPGTISPDLRSALGLGDNQLPTYVYKMRIFGYPPGWIEEATEHGSSMAVFGIDGKVADTGKGGSRFNATKMVQYAGFNVKMEKGIRDEYVKNNVPPFSKDHSTDAMLAYIRKMESTRNDNKEVCDMDVDKDDEEDNTGKEELQTVDHVSPPGCEDENSSNDTKTSLGDLETQKQQLLAELNESQSQENSQDTAVENESNCVQNTTLNASTAEKAPEQSTPSNKLKESEFGTPIIKSASPYSHLPKSENFSVGVSDVINFENLPNSTGAYEKMTGLITRVRETLKSLQDPTST